MRLCTYDRLWDSRGDTLVIDDGTISKLHSTKLHKQFRTHQNSAQKVVHIQFTTHSFL